MNAKPSLKRNPLFVNRSKTIEARPEFFGRGFTDQMKDVDASERLDAMTDDDMSAFVEPVSIHLQFHSKLITINISCTMN